MADFTEPRVTGWARAQAKCWALLADLHDSPDLSDLQIMILRNFASNIALHGLQTALTYRRFTPEKMASEIDQQTIEIEDVDALLRLLRFRANDHLSIDEAVSRFKHPW